LVVELARERTPDLCATGAGERSWQARLRTNQQKGGPASFMIVTVLRIAISRLEREDAPSTYAIAKIHEPTYMPLPNPLILQPWRGRRNQLRKFLSGAAGN